jgi:hypothetical protein
MATYTEVQHVLVTDKLHRCDGVSGDLFKLENVKFEPNTENAVPRQALYTHQGVPNEVCTALAAVPTLKSPVPFMPNFDVSKFVENFYKHAPELVGLDFNHLLVAGGFPCTLVTCPDNTDLLKSIDIDMFIFGLNVEQATRKADSLIRHIFHTKSRAESHFPVTITQSSCAISITVGDRKYQIILRLYRTLSEILHCFDLGSSAIGFNGKQVYVTSLGKFAYEHGCNVLDLSKRSQTYEMRLKKYFQRGFDIILPDLNVHKLRYKYLKYGEPEIMEMPHMQVSYTALSENKNSIRVKNIYLKNGEHESDYEDCTMWNRETITSLNISKLNAQKNPIYVLWKKSYCTEKDASRILHLRPLLQEKDIRTHYESISKTILQNGTFRFDLVEKNITVETLENIARVLFSKNSTRSARKKYITELIQMQVTVTLDRFRKWEESLASSSSKK